MNLRHLMKFLSTQEVVDRLANTPLIRRLAQMTHFTYMKASEAGQKSIDNIAAKQQQKNQLSNDSFMMSRFFQRFVQNLRNEIEKNNSKFK